jgi:hypothetical protein
MTNASFTTAITVDQSPEEVFAAINDVQSWWLGDLEGETTKPGDEFTYRYKNVHATRQRVGEMIPGRKIVWRVVSSHLDFVRNKTEWTGTDIVFDITRKGDKTELRFTHEGLEPAFECYDGCSNAWSEIISSNLRKLIAARSARRPS